MSKRFRHAGRVMLARIGDFDRPLYPYIGDLIRILARSAAAELGERSSTVVVRPMYLPEPDPRDRNEAPKAGRQRYAGRAGMTVAELCQWHQARGTLDAFLRSLKPNG